MEHVLSPATSAGAEHAVQEEFRRFISDRAFPCVGAKSAANRGRLDLVVCGDLGSERSAQTLCERLARFSSTYPTPGEDPVSLAAIFIGSAGTEEQFHDRLWRQLQLVHELDARTHGWAEGVSADPAANDFSFSVAERAFFVVGLHPHSSRLARRAPRPTLVFNFHDQFEALRASGRYAKLQAAIRERDVDLQGHINPVLAQFGDASEARQYSGKNGGVCPFHAQQAVA
jgi:FPC/CPF motif-containing protein YcgG